MSRRDLLTILSNNSKDENIEELWQRIMLAITRIPQDNRKAINLYYIKKYSRKQIACKLGWSFSKVNTKITRGISLLKRELYPNAFKVAFDYSILSKDQENLFFLMKPGV